MCALGFCAPILDLGRAYALLSRLKDGLATLRDGFETHVRSNGMAALDSLGETAETVGPGTLALPVCGAYGGVLTVV